MKVESSQAAARERWHKVLVEGHTSLNKAHAVFRFIPSAPRCKVCHNPFGGLGGKLVGLFGFTRSRKNPNLCAKCCDALPEGGADVDIAVLFADVRGSTALGERMSADAFATVLNRFYRVATEALIRHDAIIDKLIGDEVMALFIPGICGPDYKRHAVEGAIDLMKAVGYGSASEPLLPIGAAVNSGVCYVGNVGSPGVVDFTALGDPVNTASRMAEQAGAGEALLSESVYEPVTSRLPDLETRELNVRGKEAALTVRVWRV
ncbi:MAG TPA: adenylate/guanylate cyclase domain-containing protein [Candidatus Binataceae bacterium]|nr:adenylate/guanylate cyclase domain-containing protein [Candidatus Binataceae bacterium]